MRSSWRSAAFAAVLLAPGLVRATPDPAVSLATIVSATGLVRVRPTPSGSVLIASVGDRLGEGARVMTLENARTEIRFTDGHLVKLGPVTTMAVTRLPRGRRGQILLHLLSGRVKALIDRFAGKENDFGLYGATTITAVKGTDFEMARTADNRVTVAVDAGEVEVAPLKNENDLEAVQELFLGVLLGKVGLSLTAGKMLNVLPGQPFPSPIPIPANFPSPFTGPGADQHDQSKPKGPSGPSMPGLGGGFGFP